MKLVYFSWIREKIGKSEEHIELPSEISTITDIFSYLSQKDSAYAEVFSMPEHIYVAIDHLRAHHEDSIAMASEIAFFPPMTGG